jgi:hypothetical protein
VSVRGSADISKDALVAGGRAGRWAAAGGAAGIVALLAALGAAYAGGEGGSGRFFHAWLVSWLFFLSLALGALFFVMLQHLTRAGWSVVVRRVAEIVASTLAPLALLGMPLVLGLGELYPWAGGGHAAHGAHAAAIEAKRAYLNVPFFLARAALYFAVWIALAWRFASRSRAQDASGDPRLTVGLERLAAPGMVLFALTVSFFSFDWLMSLNPLWSSTIFGVYFFAGCAVGFFALLPPMLAWLQARGLARHAVSMEHYHDMGKLVFAFVVFWAYIAFSQYMLMWYANLPEETVWYRVRQQGGWAYVSLLLLAGHFLAPFVALLSRYPKRRPRLLVAVAAWVLFMHWVDVYWLVKPGRISGMPGMLDALCFVAVGCLVFAAAAARLRTLSLVPVKDPRLDESLRFENV